MAEISIILPVYRVEQYLRRCLDSICAQTFTDFEVIAINDGSPDHSLDILREYAAKDGRFIVLTQENGGLSSARNCGLDYIFAHSDSEWLTFIDSDDWVHPDYLREMYLGNLQNGTDICRTYCQRVCGESDVRLRRGFPWFLPRRLFIRHKMPMVPHTLFCGGICTDGSCFAMCACLWAEAGKTWQYLRV